MRALLLAPMALTANGLYKVHRLYAVLMMTGEMMMGGGVAWSEATPVYDKSIKAGTNRR